MYMIYKSICWLMIAQGSHVSVQWHIWGFPSFTFSCRMLVICWFPQIGVPLNHQTNHFGDQPPYDRKYWIGCG